MAENEKEEEAKENEEGEGGEGEEGAKPKKGKRLILILAVVLVVLIGAGAGLFFTGMLDGLLGKKETAEGEAPAEAPAEEGGHGEASGGGGGGGSAHGGPIFYDLPEFLVNLNTGGRGVSFLKMSVALELPNQDTVMKVEAIKPRIMDDFTTYLRELRASDLSGSAGLYRLREELLIRINKQLAPAQVNDVLFKEVIVQ